MIPPAQSLKNAAIHLDAVIAAALDAMVVTDAYGVITVFNHAAEQMFGYSSAEVIGLNVSILMPMPDSLHHHLYMERYIETRQSRIPRKGREVIAKRRNGETFYADIAISDVNLDGDIIFTAVIRDITARKTEEQKIVRLAFFDQETGLPNTYYLTDKLEYFFKHSTGNNFLILIYVGDLTDYINIFGCQGIKDVVVALAHRLKTKLPKQSLIARCDSRHLKIIYVPDKGVQVCAELLVKQIQACLNQPLEISDNRIFLNASFGICQIIPQTHTVKSLLDHADIALHIAKQHIAQNYEIFQEKFEITLHRRALLVQKLYHAMDDPPFELFLQPQISLTTQQVIGVETLIRWQDTDGKWISPAEFIPIAETIGLIKDITLWTLKKACSIVKKWRTVDQQHYRIAINISAQVICSSSFVDEIKQFIIESKITPHSLELEITETSLMLNPDTAIKTVAQLSALGISISIDDFGTGLSSLAYLKDFTVDRLKIDRSFIAHAMTHTNDKSMLEAIIKLSHDLGYQVICEGVEHKEQVLLLKQLGCDEIQGYYFAKPMHHSEFLQFAENFKFI
jgi:PAS domain S-box-containing protein